MPVAPYLLALNPQALRDYALHECLNKPSTHAAWTLAPLRPDRSPGPLPGLSPGQLALSPPDRPLTLADPADSPAACPQVPALRARSLRRLPSARSALPG